MSERVLTEAVADSIADTPASVPVIVPRRRRERTSASSRVVRERLCEIVGIENIIVDPDKFEPYSQDAVKEKFPPEAVVFPANAKQISEILRLANTHLFPVTARGGGVGYTGGAVPVEGGIVIGTDRMNRIKEINFDNLYVVTEPGVKTYELQCAVEAQGLFYPPDPSSYKDSFIGGNIAECAGGMRCAKYGVTKHYVLGLEVVLPTGEIICTGGVTTKNVVGFDLSLLMTGSEGMLGIITEATLRLIPLPEATRTVRALFGSMRAACETVTALTRARIVPVALEVMDRRAMEAVDAEGQFNFPLQAEALLLCSVDGKTSEVERDAKRVEEILREHRALAVERAETATDEARLWDARRSLSAAITRYGSLKLNNDLVVPRSRVPELVERATAIADKHETFVVNFGHAGDGNIHVNYMCNRADAAAVNRARECVKEVYQVAIDLGGTISGEHGIGYVKAPYLGLALSPETINAMKAIKHALDPNGILNPGKMFVDSG